MNPKLKHTLDSYLRIYYDPGAHSGEKNNCISLFRKRCIKNGIDPDEYQENSSANPNNNNQQRFSRRPPPRRDSNYSSGGRGNREQDQRRKSGFSYDDFFRGNPSSYDLKFDMKEPMFEKKVHNGKNVILLNTLSRKFGTENRFGIQNFCIYSESFDPSVLKMDGRYEVECSKQLYFRNHYLVIAIYEVNSNGIRGARIL